MAAVLLDVELDDARLPGPFQQGDDLGAAHAQQVGDVLLGIVFYVVVPHRLNHQPVLVLGLIEPVNLFVHCTASKFDKSFLNWQMSYANSIAPACANCQMIAGEFRHFPQNRGKHQKTPIIIVQIRQKDLLFV